MKSRIAAVMSLVVLVTSLAATLASGAGLTPPAAITFLPGDDGALTADLPQISHVEFLNPRFEGHFQTGNFIPAKVHVYYTYAGGSYYTDFSFLLSIGDIADVMGEDTGYFLGTDPENSALFIVEYVIQPWRVPGWEHPSVIKTYMSPGVEYELAVEVAPGTGHVYPVAVIPIFVTLLSKWEDFPDPCDAPCMAMRTGADARSMGTMKGRY